MERRSPALLLMLLSEERKTKPTGLIWNLVHIQILDGYPRVMERMNASSRSAGLLVRCEFK